MGTPTTTSPSSVNGSSTIDEGKDWLRERLDDGAHCPLCTQFAKTYRRKINSTMARALIVIFRQCGQGWAYLPDLRMYLAPHHSNEEPKLRYWNLLVEQGVKREDGGRAGTWRVTDKGVRFVRGEISVPKYARIFDGRCLGHTGEMVTIRDCLGSKFNYDELMAGV